MPNTVTLIGSGPVASIFAIALQKNGISFDWYGKQTQALPAMCYALHPKQITFLNQLGLYPELFPIENMQLIYNKQRFNLQSKYSTQPYLCTMLKHIELEKSYRNSCFELDIYPSTYQHILVNNNTVFIDNKTIDSKYIIAADGMRSTIMQQMHIKRAHHDPDQIAHIALVTHYEKRHDALQIFSPEGSFALLPIRPHQSNLVWCTHYQRHHAIIKNGLHAELSEIMQQNQIKLVAYRHHHFIPIQCYQSRLFYQSNIAFLGSALHTIHPIAGLGLNLSLGDIRCLLNLIIFNQPLSKYTQQRTSAHTYASYLCHIAANSRHHDHLSPIIQRAMTYLNNPLMQSYLIRAAEKLC
ncbi:FAD-dependent monooxygenase [Gammaproteobacteria bacterium]|nr:FAD-dependent monooxygenase [Gammaproteobacteria bacterium]